MRNYSTHAIVLKRIELSEKDRILTLYTKEAGKLSAIAKGCRRPGSKLCGSSEPFTYMKALLCCGRELDLVIQAEIRESFPNTKSTILTTAYAIYIMELVTRFTDDRHPNPDLFDTLLSSMYLLESGTDPELATRHFELNLLDKLGYKPHFETCLSCQTTIGRDLSAFSPSMGGMICGKCGVPPNDVIWVSGALASYAHALGKAEPHTIRNLKFPKGARRDLANTLKWHIRFNLETNLKSTEFLDMMREDC
jgi:DNA repair protein RecO (recombination protein O)